MEAEKSFEAENFLDMQEGNHFKVFSHNWYGY